MRIIIYLILIISISSCNYSNGIEESSTKKDVSIPDEFNFKPFLSNIPLELNPPESFAMAFVETSTFNNGDTIMAKLFLANRHLVYKEEGLEPLIKFQIDNYTNKEELIKNGFPITVINDTGYVKFIAQDDKLKKGESTIKTFHVSVTIPLIEKDTTFLLNQEIRINNK